MPVEISLKKSTFDPTSGSGLTLAEPVFNSSNNTLWIGKGSGQAPVWLGAGICGAFGAIAAGLTYILPTAFSVQQYIQSVGVTGAVGATGAQGAIGPTGPQGIQGIQGNTGPTGPVGDYVVSFNGLTGAVTGVTQINAGTGISITGTTNPTITNTGVQSFNGDTGSVKIYLPTSTEHETRSGITAQSEYVVFTDFVGNNFSSSIQQGAWLGQNANGGSFTISTASITSYGFDKCNGVLNFITGTTNNTTGYAGCLLQASHIPGIPTPSNGFVTKYEIECRFMTDTDVTTDATKTRIGFADTWTNSAPADGVYFERTYDTLLPLTETTFQVVFRNGGSEERINTGVTFAASTIYRAYLSVECNSSGTFTTSWEILNDTTNVTSSGTAAPTNTARYPSASTDYINPGCIIQKTGSVTTATSRLIRVDYIGTRIRRPLNRSMKLFA